MRIQLSFWQQTIVFGGVLLALFAIQFHSSWRFLHDDNGAWTQAVATARLQAGFGATKGQDFYLARETDILVPYLHHPPLYGTMVAIIYQLTGRADPASTRAIPACFHVLGLIGMVYLARRIYPGESRRPLIALAVYALVPMSSYFGKMPFNEPVGLCFIIWALAGLVAHRASASRRALLLSLIFWVLAGLTSWTAFVMLFFIAALFMWERRSGHLPGRAGEVLLITGITTGILVVLHIFWAAGWHRPGIFAAADHWGSHSVGPLGLLGRLGKAIDFHRIYFANIPHLLFLIWVGWRLRELRAGLGALTSEHRFILAGALGCLVWALLFLRQITVHAYGQFWYLPFEALAVGDIAVVLWQHCAARRRLRTALAVLAILGTLASTAAQLNRRYTSPSSYATRTAAEITARYHTEP